MVDVDIFQDKLLTWYKESKRDLPWRKNKDPYRIWVSEIMLQQTKVDTVIPYYERFLKRFPTIEHLSEAKEEEVLKLWEGLGYYSRAKNLWLGVKEVKESYGGQVPNAKQEMLSLPGIGPYTAGAILSIAYEKKVPAVDGNVMRVIARIFHLFEDITKAKTRMMIEQIVDTLIPEQGAGEFNQGLMELGAMVCTPKQPQCLLCPLVDICKGRKEGNQENLPVKSKKRAPRRVFRISLVLQYNDKLAIVKRPKEGLLANMYELPSLENDLPLTIEEWEEAMFHRLGLMVHLKDEWINVQHTFSHIHWDLKIYKIDEIVDIFPEEWIWVKKEQLKQLTFPKAYHAVIENIQK